jgi:two-component system cell cycle response regulator
VKVHPRRPLFVALVVCAVWLLVQEVRVVAFDGASIGPLSSRFAHDVMLLTAAGACLWRAVSVRVERTAWLLIGLGVVGWTFGEIYYTAVLWDESSPPIPSPADIGYLVFPLLTFAGMVFLVRGRAKFTPALLVDGIATALAVAALSAAIVFQTVLDHASGGLATVVTSLAYPVTDLILGAVGVGALASTGWRVDRTWALLTGGILLFWFADSMYLVRTAQGVYEAGGWFDAGWWGGLLMIALAAWQPVPLGRARCAGDSLRLIAAPLASGAVALELLVYGSLGSLNPLAVSLAAAALVFVMIRLTLTFRQNVGMLRASRDEAMTDSLTGLGNRRALTLALDEAFADAHDESPLVLALFDLDGFKHYNDTYGHPAGDVLLARLGANLRKYLGARGAVFRMGGDEFCALFPLHGQDRVDLLDGAALALSEHGEGFWIGCSYGSITLPGEATDAAEALRIADQRMYVQKHAGRASPSRQVKEALLSVLAARDPETTRHARAVADLVEATTRQLGLGPEERETIRLAAELHEAGRLMLAPGSASSGRDVALAGERIVAAAPALAPAAHILGTLHERWDGTGFPDGLAGEDIPLGARIVAVADAFDTLTADRPAAECLSELQRGAGTQFDPAIVAAFTATAVPFVLS